ncbi:MAG: hypothetical protein ACU0AU_13920 [Cognatishimia activa]
MKTNIAKCTYTLVSMFCIFLTAASADENIVLTDEETGRQIVLGKYYSRVYGGEVFGIHFLESNGELSMLLDAFDGFPSIRQYVDGKQKFVVVSGPNRTEIEMTHGSMMLKGSVGPDYSLFSSGRSECFDNNKNSGSSNCMISGVKNENEVTSLAYRNGEVIYGTVIQSDGAVVHFDGGQSVEIVSMNETDAGSSSGTSLLDLLQGLAAVTDTYCNFAECK